MDATFLPQWHVLDDGKLSLKTQVHTKVPQNANFSILYNARKPESLNTSIVEMLNTIMTTVIGDWYLSLCNMVPSDQFTATSILPNPTGFFETLPIVNVDCLLPIFTTFFEGDDFQNEKIVAFIFETPVHVYTIVRIGSGDVMEVNNTRVDTSNNVVAVQISEPTDMLHHVKNVVDCGSFGMITRPIEIPAPPPSRRSSHDS